MWIIPNSLKQIFEKPLKHLPAKINPHKMGGEKTIFCFLVKILSVAFPSVETNPQTV